MPQPTRRRVAVIGCGDGALAIALALANPNDVIAAFDADPVATATARRAAARHRVSDRVTFEAAALGHLLGSGYDIVVMIQRRRSGTVDGDRWTATDGALVPRDRTSREEPPRSASGSEGLRR